MSERVLRRQSIQSVGQ